MQRKNIVILGSTGSIGVNTLKVVERFPERFNVLGLTAYSNIRLLAMQIQKFSPTHVAVCKKGISEIRKKVSSGRITFFDVESDLEELVSLQNVDIVIIAMRSSAALGPFLKAVRCGKMVAPANKEALVIAGDIIMQDAKRYGARIIPIDSEQSAIFQCLEGRPREELRKVHLTASGGALLDVPKKKFDRMTVKQILNHPRWKMGKKITVDSATLMNKGFEIIEAMRLFDLSVEDIEVVIHPEAFIHSMVEFIDGSIIAQLGVTDMRLPIQYAMTYPGRLNSGFKEVSFHQLGQLTFRKPDFKKFPCLKLAITTAKKGATFPSVLNAANEEVVDAFLQERIKFSSIYEIVEKVVRQHKPMEACTLESILDADRWARERVHSLC